MTGTDVNHRDQADNSLLRSPLDPGPTLDVRSGSADIALMDWPSRRISLFRIFAVATGLALAVTWPPAGNIGGGGFMMIRRANGNTEIVDYRERAPLAASRAPVDYQLAVAQDVARLGGR